jgi:hypothetical protein
MALAMDEVEAAGWRRHPTPPEALREGWATLQDELSARRAWRLLRPLPHRRRARGRRRPSVRSPGHLRPNPRTARLRARCLRNAAGSSQPPRTTAARPRRRPATPTARNAAGPEPQAPAGQPAPDTPTSRPVTAPERRSDLARGALQRGAERLARTTADETGEERKNGTYTCPFVAAGRVEDWR